MQEIKKLKEREMKRANIAVLEALEVHVLHYTIASALIVICFVYSTPDIVMIKGVNSGEDYCC